jgi:putative oxidoreductase
VIIALWVVKGLLAAAFLGAGGAKLAGNPKMKANFAGWGFPAWFVVFVGAAEVSGAIGLLAPQTRFLAAAGLLVLMIGAAGTHLRHREYGPAVPALILAALLGVVLVYGGTFL